MNPGNRPFWKDDIENTIAVKPFTFRMSGWYAKLMVVVVQLSAFLIPAVIFALLSPLLMYVWLIVVILIYVNWFFHQRKKRQAAQDIENTQKKAYTLIGTTHLGSAIHVAGHPLLQKEQPIVLALVDDQLNIYGFETSTPLDTIYLKSIQAINTVVYDDERVPISMLLTAQHKHCRLRSRGTSNPAHAFSAECEKFVRLTGIMSFSKIVCN